MAHVNSLVCSDHAACVESCKTCMQVVIEGCRLRRENKAIQTSILEKGAIIKSLQLKLNVLNEATQNEIKLPAKAQQASLHNILDDFVMPGSFFEITKDPQKSLAFLIKTGVLRSSYNCKRCGQTCKIEHAGYMGFFWACVACSWRVSVKDGTFWAKCQLPVEKVLLFLFLFLMDCKDTEIERYLDIGLFSAQKYSKRLRKLIVKNWLDNLPKFTGTVEISEVNFFKRKIEIGKSKRPPRWVVGLIERDTGRSFIQQVKKKEKSEIIPIIQARCEIGATILTDEWVAYDHLEDYGFLHYTFDKVREMRRVSDINTHSIDAVLMWVKYEIKRKNRMGGELEDYLHEACWRRQFKGDTSVTEMAALMKAMLAILAEDTKTSTIKLETRTKTKS